MKSLSVALMKDFCSGCTGHRGQGVKGEQKDVKLFCFLLEKTGASILYLICEWGPTCCYKFVRSVSGKQMLACICDVEGLSVVSLLETFLVCLKITT